MTGITLLFLLVTSASAQASFNCTVNVKRVLVYNNGSVNILHDGRNDYTYICNLNGGYKGVSTVTCAMWTSMLQSIQSNHQKAIFYYSGEGSCLTLKTYGAAPAPVYIGSIE